MIIYEGKILRVAFYPKKDGLKEYKVYGLNIFTENYDMPKQFTDVENIPFIEVAEGIIKDKNIFCLIGYPAFDNWSNDVLIQKKRVVSPADLLGTNSYILVETSFYGGILRKLKDDERSLLVKIDDLSILPKIMNEFLSWDAFVIFASNKVDLSTDELSLILRDEEFGVNKLCRTIDILCFSEGEGQYLKISGKDISFEKTIIEVCKVVENRIASIKWYKENKDSLSWDNDSECLVRQKQDVQ